MPSACPARASAPPTGRRATVRSCSTRRRGSACRRRCGRGSLPARASPLAFAPPPRHARRGCRHRREHRRSCRCCLLPVSPPRPPPPLPPPSPPRPRHLGRRHPWPPPPRSPFETAGWGCEEGVAKEREQKPAEHRRLVVQRSFRQRRKRRLCTIAVMQGKTATRQRHRTGAMPRPRKGSGGPRAHPAPSPPHLKPPPVPAHEREVDRQDQQAERDHPEAENGQEACDAAEDQDETEGDPSCPRARKTEPAARDVDRAQCSPSALRAPRDGVRRPDCQSPPCCCEDSDDGACRPARPSSRLVAFQSPPVPSRLRECLGQAGSCRSLRRQRRICRGDAGAGGVNGNRATKMPPVRRNSPAAR